MTTTITISIIMIIIIKRIMKINCYYYMQRCLCYIILSTNSCKLTKKLYKKINKRP